MSIGSVVTLGFGGYSNANFLPTLGYGAYSVSPVVDESQSTPGYWRQSVESYMRRVAQERIDAQREVERPVVKKNRRDESYAKKSLKLALAIERFDNESIKYRAEIAAAEARNQAALAEKERIELEKSLLLIRQALLLAETQRAVFLEEMEVLDIAYFAVIAASTRIH